VYQWTDVKYKPPPLIKLPFSAPLLVIFFFASNSFITKGLNEGCGAESCLVGGIFRKRFSEMLSIAASSALAYPNALLDNNLLQEIRTSLRAIMHYEI
jgi:hypothetical protein